MRPLLSAWWWAFPALVVAAPRPAAERVSYDGYQVIRVETHGQPSLAEAQLSTVPYQLLSLDKQRHLDILVAGDHVTAFNALHLDARVLDSDLGASIAAESAPTRKWKRQVDDLAWFDSYHDYEDHIQYLQDLQALFPNNSEIVSSGKSFQDRDILGIHLWGGDGPGRPAVLYHATVHAREWIAAPVAEYITLQLITGYNSGEAKTQAFLDSYDFYIFPFVNPDGFIYTQTTNRLWRKNRQPGPSTPTNQTCIGRDINRNWAFGWDANPLGASTNPCSETFKGLAPSDAPENRGLDAFVRKLRDGAGIKLFIDWHSYGQYILSPFGYKETLYAPELAKWTKAAGLVSEAIRDVAGTTFTFGPSGAVLYVTTGAAPDHVYSVGGAEFSYTIELSDTGTHGFVLPPERIRGVVEEQWAGQRVLFGLLNETFFDGVGPAQLYGQS